MGGGASMQKKGRDHHRSSTSSDSSTSSQSKLRAKGRRAGGKELPPKSKPSADPPFSMGKLERALKAAILIQRWYRQYLARMEIRRRYTWNIFQTIEYAGEQDQMKLYNFFNALLTHIPQKPGAGSLSRDPSTAGHNERGSMDSLAMSVSSGGGESLSQCDTPGRSSSSSRMRLRKRKLFTGPAMGIDLENIPVESDYKGPHVKFPLTLQNLQEIIDAFNSKKQLHISYVAGILKLAAATLRMRGNFNQPSTVHSKQITVCGDLHGKLDDLYVIFYKNGLPSAENPYVFNGDYVDRGKKSFETLLTLLSCFLYCPDGVCLNRGNHEDHIMNMRYGFIREIRLKYKVFAGRLLNLIDQVFRSLPLGTIIDSRVLVVHGGISASTDLKLIEDVDRHKYVSILRPPVIETMDGTGKVIPLSDLYSSGNNSSEWKQVLDLLWSDPQTGNGCSPNTFRGGGSYFGSDVTDKVLAKHGLQLLIRSHECKEAGYEFMHNNKCVTVFSASNYYEEGSNKGAYIKLIGGPTQALEPYFVQFNSATPKLKGMSIRQRVGLVETSALRELRSRINERQEQLLQVFKTYDPEGSGLINVNDWCIALEKGTELKLPWRLLRGRIAELDASTGHVKYQSTFEASTVLSEDTDVTVAEVLYRNKTSLEAIFRIIDKDNSGYISMDEFSEACDLLGRHLSSPIPPQTMTEMARSMDLNKDGLISLNEFLESFRIVSSGQDCLDVDEDEGEDGRTESGEGPSIDPSDLPPDRPPPPPPIVTEV